MFIPSFMKTLSKIFLRARYGRRYDNNIFLCQGVAIIKINITFVRPLEALKGRPEFV
jgi:hypothetical protein